MQTVWRKRPRAPLFVGLLVVVAAASSCERYRQASLNEASLAARLERQANVLGSPVGSEADLPITSEAVERLALLFNPAIHSARLEAGVATASAEEAGRWADPTVGVEALRILDPEAGQSAGIFGASLTFTLPISGRLQAEKKLARAERQTALTRAWVAEQELIEQVRIAWAELVLAQRLHRAAKDSEAVAAELVQVGERLRAAGELAPAEAAAFEAAAIERRLLVAEREARLRTAQRELARVVGVSPGVRFVPPPSPSATRPPVGGFDPRTNPEVLLAEAEFASAGERLRLAIRGQYPDLEIGPLYGREDGADRLGLGFSLPIPLLNGNRREIAEAKAGRELAQARWEEARLKAEADEAHGRAEVARLESRVAAMQAELLPLAKARLAEMQRLHAAGEVSALLVLEALRAADAAEREAAESARDRDVAAAALAYVVTHEPLTNIEAPEGAKP